MSASVSRTALIIVSIEWQMTLWNSIRKKKQRKTLSERESGSVKVNLATVHRACWEYAAFDVKCFLTPNAHSDINWDIVNLCMLMHYYSVLNWIGIWYIMIQEWILNLLPQCILNSSQTKTLVFLNMNRERESWLQVFCSWTHLTGSFSSPLGGQYLSNQLQTTTSVGQWFCLVYTFIFFFF